MAGIYRCIAFPNPFEFTPDGNDRFDCRHEVVAGTCQMVLDRRRRGRLDLPGDNAFAGELSQSCGEYLGRNAWEVNTQFIKPARAGAKIPDNICGPGAAYNRHTLG